MKKVLILGANSYIGCSFQAYVEQNYPGEFQVDRVSLRGNGWQEEDWSEYDSVIHMAAKVHAAKSRFSEEELREYEVVNCELPYETAKKSLTDGVKQYIFFSSMSIYGGGDGRKAVTITADTKPSPQTPYGKSKWRAEQKLQELFREKTGTKLAILRPPMIYGKNCKGNYQILAKIAGKCPIFPDYNNERSMLYIDNLSEFLVKLTKCGAGGVYFPQDREYVKTSDMVSLIAGVRGKKVRKCRMFNSVITLLKYVPGKIGRLARKAFGSLVYEKEMGDCVPGDYRKCSLEESIERTEKM